MAILMQLMKPTNSIGKFVIIYYLFIYLLSCNKSDCKRKVQLFDSIGQFWYSQIIQNSFQNGNFNAIYETHKFY